MDHDSDEDRLIREELSALRKRVAELESALARKPPAGPTPPEDELSIEDALLRMLSAGTPGHAALLDAIPAMVFFKDRSHRYLLVNKAYADHYHLAVDQIVGKRDEEIFHLDTAHCYRENDEAIMASGVPRMNVELEWKLENGDDGWTLENNVPVRDASGRVIGMVGVVIDVTARKRTDQALRRTEAELRAAKQRLIETVAALSTPVLPIDKKVLVMPLVGHIDSTRSGQIMDALLKGVERYDADFVIIDLTGVPLIDSAVAFHILRAINAVLLLGAQCILVGISGTIAQSLVHTGDALENLIILRDLQAGVRYAMARQKLTNHLPQGLRRMT